MYDINKIQGCYEGEIGWRDSINPCDKPLRDYVTTSQSGQFFNEFHPLLTYDNIKSIAVNPSKYNFQTWDIAEEYNTGDVVIYKVGKYDCYFQSLIDNNIGLEPDQNPTEWEEVDYLSDWYKERTDMSFNKLITC